MVCLKNIVIVHTAKVTELLEKRSIGFYDVTMSYGFKKQILTFCDNHIPFYRFFCHFVKILVFDKIKNFWLFSLSANDEHSTTNQTEISCQLEKLKLKH